MLSTAIYPQPKYPKKESGRRHYQAPFSPTLLFAAEAIREYTHNDYR
ncbi:hypothetical protein [Sphaerospermopsis sp. LEGE 08334]|jgi:hypothetical protein|nr:hypothetical protein [Sphaerospermopsis sp. LEGE 08334]MBE9056231.1 hypothetical protein [Sphaerospermopsis sp. LEGE 08334]